MSMSSVTAVSFAEDEGSDDRTCSLCSGLFTLPQRVFADKQAAVCARRGALGRLN